MLRDEPPTCEPSTGADCLTVTDAPDFAKPDELLVSAADRDVGDALDWDTTKADVVPPTSRAAKATPAKSLYCPLLCLFRTPSSARSSPRSISFFSTLIFATFRLYIQEVKIGPFRVSRIENSTLNSDSLNPESASNSVDAMKKLRERKC